MRERMCAYKIWWGNLGRKKLLGRPRLRWEDNIKWFFKNCDGGLWTGFMWLRTGTGGGLL